jgi:hypothetical protein
MANKVTKKDNFNALRALALAADNADLVAFVDHELELLAKKAENRSTKPTVRQAENAEIKTAIVSSMEHGRLYRCAEIKAMIPALAEGEGTQRTARLCNDLEKEKLLTKKVEKKVVYFALAE